MTRPVDTRVTSGGAAGWSTRGSTGPLESSTTVAGTWVSLRPASSGDYPALFRWRSLLEANLLNFNRRIATYEEFVGELDRLLPVSTLLLVRDNQLGAPIGFVLGYHVNPWDGWMFVGAHVEKSFRYRGHGGEAIPLGLDAVFRMFPIRMVYTEVYDYAGPLLRAGNCARL